MYFYTADHWPEASAFFDCYTVLNFLIDIEIAELDDTVKVLTKNSKIWFTINRKRGNTNSLSYENFEVAVLHSQKLVKWLHSYKNIFICQWVEWHLVKCTQEFVLVTFHSHSTLTNRQNIMITRISHTCIKLLKVIYT